MPNYLSHTTSSKSKRNPKRSKSKEKFNNKPKFTTYFKEKDSALYNNNFYSSKNNFYENNEFRNTSSSCAMNINLRKSAIKNNNYENKKSNEMNFGERLYHKDLGMKEKILEKTKNKLAFEHVDKDSDCTFMPKINKLNINSVMYRNNNKLAYNDRDIILNYKNYKESLIEKRKMKYFMENEKNNTFVPKIDPNSIKMQNQIENDSKISRFEKLYNQRPDIKLLEKKIYKNNKFFKPKTNNSFKGIYCNLPFNERQKIYRAKSAEKQLKLSEQINAEFDYETGQRLFHPTVNKYRLAKRNVTVYNNLYSCAEKSKIKKEELVQQIIRNEKDISEFKANEKSEDLISKHKVIAFKKIFKILDKDRDNKISQLNLGTKNLPKKIQKIISPIVDELKEENETLNQDEFVIACERLFEMLDYVDKKEIYSFSLENNKKRNTIETMFSFKPKINENSKKINEQIIRYKIVPSNNNKCEKINESNFLNENNSPSMANNINFEEKNKEVVNKNEYIFNEKEFTWNEKEEFQIEEEQQKQKQKKEKEKEDKICKIKKYENLVIQKDEEQIIDNIQI